MQAQRWGFEMGHVGFIVAADLRRLRDSSSREVFGGEVVRFAWARVTRVGLH